RRHTRCYRDWSSDVCSSDLLPRKDWSRRLLRGLSVFWVFGGFLVIATGITGLPVLKNFRGALLLVIVPIIAALSTALLLWRTPHRQERSRKRRVPIAGEKSPFHSSGRGQSPVCNSNLVGKTKPADNGATTMMI